MAVSRVYLGPVVGDLRYEKVQRLIKAGIDEVPSRPRVAPAAPFM
jgi:hypothetical protein